jgi:hypothetical protein
VGVLERRCGSVKQMEEREIWKRRKIEKVFSSV